MNLNNAAGSNRSNVGWGDLNGTFYGDSFSIAGTGQAAVSSIRTWITGGSATNINDLYSSLSLWLGGTNLTNTGYSFTATLVTYANSETYQGTFGSYRNLWQIDWNTSGLMLDTNTTYNFGVTGTTTATGLAQLGYQDVVFLHSSNAGLSGSPQEGANGLLNYYNADGTFNSTYNSFGNGWDKSSDANIQVFGMQPVPEPFTMAFAAAGLGVAVRRKLKKQKA